jgi:hypothetical protein
MWLHGVCFKSLTICDHIYHITTCIWVQIIIVLIGVYLFCFIRSKLFQHILHILFLDLKLCHSSLIWFAARESSLAHQSLTFQTYEPSSLQIIHKIIDMSIKKMIPWTYIWYTNKPFLILFWVRMLCKPCPFWIPLRVQSPLFSHIMLYMFYSNIDIVWWGARGETSWLAWVRSHGARHLFYGFIWITRSSPSHVLLLDADWIGGDTSLFFSNKQIMFGLSVATCNF